MVSITSYGALSPPLPDAPTPRLEFDSETLKAYIKKLLETTLQNEPFPAPRDREKVNSWCKEIGARVKERMLGSWLGSFDPSIMSDNHSPEIQPRGLYAIHSLSEYRTDI